MRKGRTREFARCRSFTESSSLRWSSATRRGLPAQSEVLVASGLGGKSLQNWQSEFLSIAALVLLSIVLRQKGSPESKPVHAPRAQTGTH